MRRFFKRAGMRVDAYANDDLQIVRGLVAVLVTLGMIFTALALAFSAIVWTQQRQTTNDLHTGLVHSCLTVGDPQRQALIQLIEQQQQSAKGLDLKSFFPDVPPSQLKELIKQAREQRNDLLRQLEAVPSCQVRFR